MTRSTTLALALTCLALGAVAAPGIAQADNDKDPAITLKDKEHPVGCHAFGLQTTDKIHTVEAANGNTKLICDFSVPEGQRPAKMEEKKGFACGIYLPTGNKTTTDTVFQKTPGGTAKLECTVKL